MDLIRALASPRVPARDPAGSASAALGSAAPGPGPGPGLAADCVPAGATAAPTGSADSEGHPADQGACGGTAGMDDGAVGAPGAAGAASGEGKHPTSMSPGAASASGSAGDTEDASGEGAAAAGAGESRAQGGAGQAETGPSARAARRVRLVSPVRPPQAPAEARALSAEAAEEPGTSKPAVAGGRQSSGPPLRAHASSDVSVLPSSPVGAVLGDAASLSGGEGPRFSCLFSDPHTLQRC